MTTFNYQDFDFAPWQFWRTDSSVRAEYQGWPDEYLDGHPAYCVGENTYISPRAGIQADRFVIGRQSYVAGVDS